MTRSGFRPEPRLARISLFLMACMSATSLAFADTHLVIITGVGGDEERTSRFAKWSIAALDAAKKHGVPEANITYLGENLETSGGRMKARATRENVRNALIRLADSVKPDDEIFVLLIGHGSFDGQMGAFNLPGPDLTTADYAALLDRFKTQKIAFVNTASSSGAFVQPLAGPARTIVAATRTGGERNETQFAEFFVEALDAEAADRDRNGRVSVLEAFDYAAGKVKAAYEKEGHILTEHATLDDGNQGKLAATQFFAPERSRTAAARSADPALRALLEERDALERQVTELRLRKDSIPADRYEQELEKLVTELALKSQAIRAFESRK